jgi:hypothetical protein
VILHYRHPINAYPVLTLAKLEALNFVNRSKLRYVAKDETKALRATQISRADGLINGYLRVAKASTSVKP